VKNIDKIDFCTLISYNYKKIMNTNIDKHSDKTGTFINDLGINFTIHGKKDKGDPSSKKETQNFIEGPPENNKSRENRSSKDGEITMSCNYQLYFDHFHKTRLYGKTIVTNTLNNSPDINYGDNVIFSIIDEETKSNSCVFEMEKISPQMENNSYYLTSEYTNKMTINLRNIMLHIELINILYPESRQSTKYRIISTGLKCPRNELYKYGIKLYENKINSENICNMFKFKYKYSDHDEYLYWPNDAKYPNGIPITCEMIKILNIMWKTKKKYDITINFCK